MNPIIIQGSARSAGNTRKAIEDVIQHHPVSIIDLLSLDIGPYDYTNRHKDDDFVPLIEHILQYKTLVLATPVYWYTMSGQMKIFLDRITDLLEFRTDLLDKLRGKDVFVLASFGGAYTECFEDPFEKTCHYLNMNYIGCSMIYSGTENSEYLAKNREEILKARTALKIQQQAAKPIML